MNIREKFLAVRVGRPWHRVPRAAVTAAGSLEVSKARLDRVWSKLGWWKKLLLMSYLNLPWCSSRPAHE